jgi:hypothetical protein
MPIGSLLAHTWMFGATTLTVPPACAGWRVGLSACLARSFIAWMVKIIARIFGSWKLPVIARAVRGMARVWPGRWLGPVPSVHPGVRVVAPGSRVDFACTFTRQALWACARCAAVTVTIVAGGTARALRGPSPDLTPGRAVFAPAARGGQRAQGPGRGPRFAGHGQAISRAEPRGCRSGIGPQPCSRLTVRPGADGARCAQ